MDTLDQGDSNFRISERAIRNLTSSGVWVIISSACGLFFGLFMLYVSFRLMSMSSGMFGRGAAQVGSIYMIIGLVMTAMHAVGLSYGASLGKLKIYNSDDFDRATSRQNAYWIFTGIVYIIWVLLMLLGIANGGMRGLMM